MLDAVAYWIVRLRGRRYRLMKRGRDIPHSPVGCPLHLRMRGVTIGCARGRCRALICSSAELPRVLCIFPHYAPAFGTFNPCLRLMKGVRAFMPPQGLLLIAAYMPQAWPVRFIDENISRATAC